MQSNSINSQKINNAEGPAQDQQGKTVIIHNRRNPSETVEMYYQILGKGKPILIIHGFFPDHRLMKGCMEPIFQNHNGWKRIYFDLPGMGRTKSKPWIKNSDQMLEIILDFVDTIIPVQTFLLVGESYGGYMARGIINKRPESVDGLLLICPLIIAEANKRILPKHVILIKDQNLLSRIPKDEADEFNSLSVIQNQRIWERFRDEVLSALKISDEAFLTNFQEKGYAFSFDLDSLRRQYDNPTLFILGKQDHIVGYKDAWEILESYPRSSFVVLDKAGHNLQIEQEKLFNELVTEWLNRVANNSD